MTHALTPGAAAGRTPEPLSVCPGEHPETEPAVPIAAPDASVQDQLADDGSSPLHSRLHVYGRSTAVVAASGRTNGAVGLLRTVGRCGANWLRSRIVGDRPVVLAAVRLWCCAAVIDKRQQQA